MARRRRSHWRVVLAPTQLEDVARAVLGEQLLSVTDGYALTPSSGVWRRANGTYTVKLVYRERQAEPGPSTLSFTIRNVGHHILLGASVPA